jgi:malonate-semialdehyde dehydrogenase (acetylating)/methylmalonate-semialdehyde dehydrogenase
MSTETIPHFVDGRRVIGVAEQQRVVASPLDGTALGVHPTEDFAFVNQAVKSAAIAYQAWREVPIQERVQPLYRFKQLVERNLQELATMVSAESGKTVGEAAAGIQKGLEVVEYACSLPAVGAGSLLEVSKGVDCYSRRYPLGVVAGITPFNFPAMVPMWMFPIAIACGNSFLLKPSDKVPLTPIRLGEYLIEAGLPKGVFNVVQGSAATVDSILAHQTIKAVAFVGSTRIAQRVYLKGVTEGKKMLALGGAKNHLVVVPDADVEVTAKNVASSVTGCAGQRCMAASVLITVGDCSEVMDAICEELSKIVPGENLGAVISAEAKERIEGYINRAEQDGARILLDGRGAKVAGKPNGFYVGPTVIDNVETTSDCACDEVFGPVLTVLPVETLDEALVIENASPYGNAASIYTTNGASARYFELHASAGMVGINIGVPVPREPFSFGGWNASQFGSGDITGNDGIQFWTKQKKVTEKWTAGSARNWMS